MSSRAVKKRYGRNELEELEQAVAGNIAVKSSSVENVPDSGSDGDEEEESLRNDIKSSQRKNQNLFALALVRGSDVNLLIMLMTRSAFTLRVEYSYITTSLSQYCT